MSGSNGTGHGTAGHSAKKKHGGGHHEEEHENHERWLISYADMVTLLMALFLVLFAMSNVDEKKAELLAQGIADGFGYPEYVPLDGGDAILESGDEVVNPVAFDALTRAVPVVQPEGLPNSEDSGSTGGSAQELLAQQQQILENRLAEAQSEAEDLEQVAADLDGVLAQAGLDQQAEYRIDERGLVIALVADDILFENGQADLRPQGVRILDAAAPVLAATDLDIDVEGHANHLPVAPGGTYPSNWELSAARAGSVVRHLIERDGLDPTRLSAIGHADTQPLVPIDSPEAITRNRRVDIIVVSSKAPEVRALLPEVAADFNEEG